MGNTNRRPMRRSCSISWKAIPRCSCAPTRWRPPGRSSCRSSRRGRPVRRAPFRTIVPIPGGRWTMKRSSPGTGTTGSPCPRRNSCNDHPVSRQQFKRIAMELHVYKDGDALSKAAAEWISRRIAGTLSAKPRFTIALSGGNTPKRLHRLLSQPPYRDRIDWARMHVFWGDERAVPFNDPRNNARMAFDTLLDLVPIPPGQIHIMKTDRNPEQSAAEYEQLLHEYFDGAQTSFDLVLLGLGDNAHTLSLFPGEPVVHEEKAWAKA